MCHVIFNGISNFLLQLYSLVRAHSVPKFYASWCHLTSADSHIDHKFKARLLAALSVSVLGFNLVLLVLNTNALLSQRPSNSWHDNSIFVVRYFKLTKYLFFFFYIFTFLLFTNNDDLV